jgi:hypothetical protein
VDAVAIAGKQHLSRPADTHRDCRHRFDVSCAEVLFDFFVRLEWKGVAVDIHELVAFISVATGDGCSVDPLGFS